MNLENFKLAYQLNTIYKVILLKEKVHFRANLNSLSLISVSSKKPEIGIKCNLKNYKSNRNIQNYLKSDIDKIKSKPYPRRNTPEKKLQSWIINFAQKNNNKTPFDNDIIFLTSELALRNKENKKIVTDILGYSISKNQLCIIELKSSRLLKRLIEQVIDFEYIINKHFEFLKKLLSIHGIKNTKGISREIMKIIIWPYKNNIPKKELIKFDIQEYTYQENYTFQNFPNNK